MLERFGLERGGMDHEETHVPLANLAVAYLRINRVRRDLRLLPSLSANGIVCFRRPNMTLISSDGTDSTSTSETPLRTLLPPKIDGRT